MTTKIGPKGSGDKGMVEHGAINRSVLLATLSRALDLTEGAPLGHAIRSCWIGMQLANALQLPQGERTDLYYGLLLKDAGCSANAAQVSHWFGVDDQAAKRDLKVVNWSRMRESVRYAARHARPGSTFPQRLARLVSLGLRGPRKTERALVEMRCTRGADLVRKLGWVDLAPAAVLHLDEHWDGSGQPQGLRGPEIPLLARILNLAQTTEVFWARFGADAAKAMIRDREGTWFDPDLTKALLVLAQDDGFFTALSAVREPRDIAPFDPDPRTLTETADRATLTEIARVFAEIVDTKSPWTAHHSARTSRYAGAIARELGCDGGEVGEIAMAASYHDLGKLGVSNLVLDKPGRLTSEERQAVERHVVWTHDLLEPVASLGHVVDLAASHHERLDGSGYASGLSGPAIPFGSRIIAVADVFDALTADRPYRKALDPDDAFRTMKPDRGTRLDADAYDALVDGVRNGHIPLGSDEDPARRLSSPN